jgi:hypothetical protein
MSLRCVLSRAAMAVAISACLICKTLFYAGTEVPTAVISMFTVALVRKEIGVGAAVPAGPAAAALATEMTWGFGRRLGRPADRVPARSVG